MKKIIFNKTNLFRIAVELIIILMYECCLPSFNLTGKENILKNYAQVGLPGLLYDVCHKREYRKTIWMFQTWVNFIYVLISIFLSNLLKSIFLPLQMLHANTLWIIFQDYQTNWKIANWSNKVLAPIYLGNLVLLGIKTATTKTVFRSHFLSSV